MRHHTALFVIVSILVLVLGLNSFVLTRAERINEEVKGWTFKSPAGRKQLKELEEKLGPKEFEKLSDVLKRD